MLVVLQAGLDPRDFRRTVDRHEDGTMILVVHLDAVAAERVPVGTEAKCDGCRSLVVAKWTTIAEAEPGGDLVAIEPRPASL